MRHIDRVQKIFLHATARISTFNNRFVDFNIMTYDYTIIILYSVTVKRQPQLSVYNKISCVYNYIAMFYLLLRFDHYRRPSEFSGHCSLDGVASRLSHT